MGAGLDVIVREHGQVCVVHPQGTLTERTGIELRRVMAEVLLEQGRAVVDLDEFRLARESCVTIFPAVLDHCGGWPRVRMVLCRPDDGMARALARRRISALVPVCQRLPEAEEAMEQRPTVVRARTRLSCDDRAPDLARELVRDSCPMWQVDAERQQIAELVVNELVDNAVRHARTAAALTLERGPHGLRIAVRDAAPSGGFFRSAEPSARPKSTGQGLDRPGLDRRRPDGRGRRGRGLELVARLSTAWGVQMHPVGKTIWAEIVDADQPGKFSNG